VTIEAPVASFRYPHFLIGRQPTFEVPPPSTIVGHIASALGEWPTTPFQFAYAFQSRGRASDLEHQHIISRTSGKLPGDVVDPHWRPPEPKAGKKLSKKEQAPRLLEKTTEAVVQPHLRDFLFDVRLELYLDPPELAQAFRSPVFTVVLGRSQDLASIQRVEFVDLQASVKGYMERTILPSEFRRRLPWGVTTLMPRYVGPAPERRATFSPYIVLRDRIYIGYDHGVNKQMLQIAGEQDLWWMDPHTADDRGGRRLLWFHSIDPREFENGVVS
jgi:CRISPR-associated protein Cas5t